MESSLIEDTMNAGSGSRRFVYEETEWSEEPMSPIGRLMEDVGVHIVAMLGLGIPLNLPVFRAGIEKELLPRYPRFSSIQVMDDSAGGKPRWVRTEVNLDDHIIVPNVDPTVVASDPEKAVEDYVAALTTVPMDRRRPLWDFHFLDFPTPKATSTMVLRMHHSIGDGMSFMTLFVALSRSTDDPSRQAAMPPLRRTGPIYQLQPRPLLLSCKALLVWLLSYLVLAWHTLVDGVLLVATILFLCDPRTLFTRADSGRKAHLRKRFVHRSLSLDDVKFIKTAVNCSTAEWPGHYSMDIISLSSLQTINDVLVGVTSAAISQYYFRKSGDITSKKICLRSFLLVDARPASSRQTFVSKVETGNRFSGLICPFHIALHDDPLEHVRKAKRLMDRKKNSLEVMLTRVVGEFLVKYLGVKIGAFVLRLLLRRTTIMLSNVVGPAEQITLCGHPIVFMAGSIYGQPQALTVHYENYGNTIEITLAVDDAQFPDCHQLLDDFDESIKLIKDAASLHTLTSIHCD